MLGATGGAGGQADSGAGCLFQFVFIHSSLFIVQRSTSQLREALASCPVLRNLPEAGCLFAVIDDAIHYCAE